ncbi:MAG TPA: hypothetical protein PLK67_18460 [Bryobacteraceae bacterium]|nr:hypothetical protein [Bryobacteraceae bacterium]
MLFVKYAELLFAATNTRLEKRALRLVATVPLALPERVYNLTVADQEMYYANGILVHNCQYLCLHAEALQGGKLEKPQARKIEVASAAGWT